MSVHVEYVIPGVPISNQPASPPALRAWRADVKRAATTAWAAANASAAPLLGPLKAVIINFHVGSKPSLDLDNMSKPILDVMQGVVYDNDRQVRQAELTHVPINAPFVFVGASKLIVEAVRSGKDFVYVRIEDPIHPFPLPA